MANPQSRRAPTPERMLDLYLHLARIAESQRRPTQRDQFLALAAGIAYKAGFPNYAEHCRTRLLLHNPDHMYKNFRSMKYALRAEDVRQYLRQLLRIYPVEKADYLLDKFRAAGYVGDHGYGLARTSDHHFVDRADHNYSTAPPRPKPKPTPPRREDEWTDFALPPARTYTTGGWSVSYGSYLCGLVFAFATGAVTGGVAMFLFWPFR